MKKWWREDAVKTMQEHFGIDGGSAIAALGIGALVTLLEISPIPGGKVLRGAVQRQRGAIGDFEPDTIVTPSPANEISARYPTAVARVADPDESRLLSDLTSVREHGGTEKYADVIAKYEASMTEMISQYPGMGAYRGGNGNDIMSGFEALVGDNLKMIYNEMPSELRIPAKAWYEGANKIRGGLAREYGIRSEAASGVIASQSPQTEWNTNLARAERIIDTWSNHQNTVMTPEMEALGRRLGPYTPDVMASITGKRLADIDDHQMKGAWIRLYDEAHNPREYNIWGPTGNRTSIATTKKGEPGKVAWNSFGELGKGVSILEDQSLSNISRNLGEAHKVRNFYNNIESPFSPDFFTSDTHNVAASLMRPLAAASDAVGDSMGGKGSSILGVKGSYPLFHDAANKTAAELGLLPRELQSITWEGGKGIFDPTFKRAAGKTGVIDDIWRQVDDGKITATEARESIFEITKGINKPPEWYSAPSHSPNQSGMSASEAREKIRPD